MKLSKFSIADHRNIASYPIVRFVFAVLAVATVTACTTTGGYSRMKSGPIYSTLTVDVETVRSKNLGSYADVIARSEKAAIDATYAGQIEGKHSSLPSLLIEIDSIDMGIEHDSGFSIDPMRDGASEIMDTLDGFAVIKKGGKELRKDHVIVSRTYPENRPYSATDTQDRLNALTRAFAERARMQLGD
jgi:hypothetical protein